MKIGLIDPALYTATRPSPNIGDLVISRACHREIRNTFGESADIVAIPSHDYPSRSALKRLDACDHVLVGGSNLLWFRWPLPASWKIGLWGLAYYRDLILLGVGWGSYEISANAHGRWLCRIILSRDRIHSVRDAFTREIASDGLKINKVVNTACPTMWCLTPELSAATHTERGDECIFSITDYAKDPERDRALLRHLSSHYRGRLLFWPQGDGDADYCRSLGYTGRTIDRSLPALLQLLAAGAKFDYVGTRLHAGILCLEHRVRSLIISVDNRAAEIARDTGLPCVARNDEPSLLKWLAGDTTMNLQLPLDAIAQWRNQFQA